MFEKLTKSNILQITLSAFLVISMAACSSKKKTDDAAAANPDAATEAPQIDSTPMSFDAAGSDSGKISGLFTINFEYDRSSLTADAKEKIQKNAEWMKGNPKANLQIEGHCDSRGSIEYNLSLGERRAQSVKAYMASLGVANNRMSIISYGKEKPLVNGDTEADHQKNRRANFVPISN
jgi:peptidoglycan-associated lipoprotein